VLGARTQLAGFRRVGRVGQLQAARPGRWADELVDAGGILPSAMSEPITDQAAVILLERVAVPLVNSAGTGLWSWLRARFGRGTGEVVEEVATDFTWDIALRLRDEAAIVIDVTSVVPNVMVWFEVINHSDVDLVLDRIVLELRVGQPILHGVMAHRYPIPPHKTVSTITFFGMLTEGAMQLVRQFQQQGHQTIHVTARAYFDAPAAALRFAIDGTNLFRSLPGA
jgi:hypothetical protein